MHNATEGGKEVLAGVVWFWIGPHEEYERLIHQA
jgi:hypothetical protein